MIGKRTRWKKASNCDWEYKKVDRLRRRESRFKEQGIEEMGNLLGVPCAISLPGCPLACGRAKVRQVCADRWAQQQSPRTGSTTRFESMVLYKSKARLFSFSGSLRFGVNKTLVIVRHWQNHLPASTRNQRLYNARIVYSEYELHSCAPPGCSASPPSQRIYRRNVSHQYFNWLKQALFKKKKRKKKATRKTRIQLNPLARWVGCSSAIFGELTEMKKGKWH